MRLLAMMLSCADREIIPGEGSFGKARAKALSPYGGVKVEIASNLFNWTQALSLRRFSRWRRCA